MDGVKYYLYHASGLGQGKLCVLLSVVLIPMIHTDLTTAQ